MINIPNKTCRSKFRLKTLLAAAGFGLAMLSKSAHADFVFLDNDFNDATGITNSGEATTVFSNTNGIGGGFNVATWSGGAIIESNSVIVTTSPHNGADRNGFSSVNGVSISSSGTRFEWKNVRFTQDPTSPPNTTGHTDRLYFGVASTNDLAVSSGGWQANPPPGGFYVQIESDSVGAGTGGSSAFDENSVLFYRNAAGQYLSQPLAQWRFDNLRFASVTNGGNYSPTLDVQLTLDGAHWSLTITGDTRDGGSPISFSGNYSDLGINPGELTTAYVVGFDQTENPGIDMSIDRVIVSQLGSFIVGTPKISTPDYPYNTNNIFAGEQVTLSDTATGPGTLSYQWQQANYGSDSFADISGATTTNYTLNTVGLDALSPLAFRMVVSNNSGLSSTSAPVTLTVAAASAPVISSDITPASATNYVGGTVVFSANFNGNHPIAYRWQYSADDSTWTNISGATNISITLANVQLSSAGYYRLTGTNSVGGAASTEALLTILTGGQHITWSSPVNFGGLTAGQILTNVPGKLAGAAMFGGSGPVTVSIGNGYPDVVFSRDGSVAAVTTSTGTSTGAFGTNTTGNANFDTVLGGFNYDNGPKLIALSNLVVGQQYSVQLFALDDRSGVNGPRMVSFQDPNDAADVSAAFATVGANSYIVGTFYASNTTEVIQENLLNGSGNMNALVLRAVGWNPPPYFAAHPASVGGYATLNATFSVPAGGYSALTYQWKAGFPGGPYTNLVEGAKYTGTTTANLTVNNLAVSDASLVYVVTVSDAGGSVSSQEIPLSVYTLANNPMLIGRWLAGGPNLTDYATNVPAGTHDGLLTGANYYWTNDVPPYRSGYSLHFGANNSDTVVVITNTWNTPDDPGYQPTFDDNISGSFSLACWAKGFPATWSPWVSKRGEDNIGFQLRRYGGDARAAITVRGTSAANGGDLEAAASSNDGQWHYYVGTFDAVQGLETIYVDGVKSGQYTGVTGQLATAPYSRLVIGGRNNNGGDNASGPGGFESILSNSSIYDVRIYNYALSPSQVSSIYNPPALTFTKSSAGLVLSWSSGVLLESTNLLGPWTTNNSTSPFTNTVVGPQKFYRVQGQ